MGNNPAMKTNSLAPSNGSAEVQRLSSLVEQLQAECETLRAALGKSNADRDRYLKAIYAYERAKIDFTDVDFDELVKSSAGQVETID